MSNVNLNTAAQNPSDKQQTCFGPPTFPIGMAYVPMQDWIDLYEPELGFNRGTIFSQLDLPFIGEEVL